VCVSQYHTAKHFSQFFQRVISAESLTQVTLSAKSNTAVNQCLFFTRRISGKNLPGKKSSLPGKEFFPRECRCRKSGRTCRVRNRARRVPGKKILTRRTQKFFTRQIFFLPGENMFAG